MKPFFFLFCAVLIVSSDQMMAADSRQDDSLALVAFYNSTKGSSWTDHTNWLTDKPIDQWVGVTLNVAGRVIDLTLTKNNISGPIPKEIGNLTALDNLSLRSNSLTGTLPSEFGNLTSLTSVNLSVNGISGELPKSIKNLKKLEYLYFSSNRLSGSIPHEIGEMVSLTNLYLWDNLLTGSIPNEIGNITNLEVLRLDANKLSGQIPKEIGKLSNLVMIQMQGNQLSGEIPKEIGNLTDLNILQLFVNALTGQIPSEIGKLTNLRTLELDENQLSGEIPKEIGNLTNLESLFLRSNKLTGSIPKELGNLTKLPSLELDNNLLSGKIPAEFSQLTALKTVYLNNNQLSGGLANLPKITFDSIYIHNNRFNFDELELTISAKNYRYAPQDSLGISHDTTLDAKQELHLTSIAGTTTNNSYQWYKNGVEIPFASTNKFVISSATKDDEGVYTYQATNSGVKNLILHSRPVTVKVKEEAGGVEEGVLSKVLTVQPNPAITMLTVQFTELGTSVSSLTVYDELGSIVRTINSDTFSDKFQIDVTNFTNGVYVIRANAGRNSVSKRFIVHH